MQKIVPHQSALHYFKLGQAVFKEKCSHYLSKNIPEAELLESYDIQKYKFILIKNRNTNELVIVFHGKKESQRTNKIKFKVLSPLVLDNISEEIKRWKEKHNNKISVMLSHTDSSYLASKLAKDTLLITFNGYNVEKGENRINFATLGSICNRVNTHPNDYIVLDLGEPGHPCFTKNKTIESYLREKSWPELISTFVEPETPEISDINVIEKLLDKAVPENILDALIDKFNSLLSSYDEYKADWEKAFQSDETPIDRLKDVADDIYTNQHHLDFWEREAKELLEPHQQQKHSPNTLPFLPEIQRSIYFGIAPNGSILDRMKESRKNLEEYDNLQRSLQSLLIERKTQQSKVQSLRDDFEQIDKEIHKKFKELSTFEKKVRHSLEIMERTLSISSIIIGTQPISKLVTTGVSLLSWGNNIGKGIATKSTLRHQKTEKEDRKKRAAVLDELNGEEANNDQEIRIIRKELASSPNILPAAGNYTDPHLYRETLQKNDSQLKRVIEDSEKSLKVTQAACDETERKIEQLEKEVEDLNEQKKTIGKETAPSNDAWSSFGKEKEDSEQSEKLEKEIQTKKKEKNDEERKLYLLEKKRSSESSTLEKLKESEENISKLREQENELAPLREFFYESMKGIADRDKHLDEKILNWRKTAEKGLAELNYEKEHDRKLIEGTLSGFIDIFSEAQQFSSLMGYNGESFTKMQMGVGVLQQATRIRDLSISWYETHETIKLTQEKLLKDGKSATYFDAIQALGHGIFIGHYIIPGLQIAASAMALFRLSAQLHNGNFTTKTREEVMFKELGEFLHAFSKNIDQKFEILEGVIDANHKELLTTVNLARTELRIVRDELLHEINHSRKEIISVLDKTNHFKFETRLNDIKKEIPNLFEDVISEDRSEKQVQPIKKLLKVIATNLNEQILDPSNCGISIDIDDRVTTHLPLYLATKNPVLYASLIAKKLGYKEYFCPYLLSPLVMCYSRLMAYVEDQKIDIGDMEYLCQRIEQKIKEQLEKILPFLDKKYLDQAICDTRTGQNRFINSIAEQKKRNSEFIKIISKFELQKSITNQNFNNLEDSDRVVGPKKFRYANVILHQQLNSSYEQVERVEYSEHVQKQLKERDYVSYIPNAVGAGAGLMALGGTIAPGINPIFGALAFVLGNTPNCWDLYRYLQEHQEINKRTSEKKFDQRSIIDLTTHYRDGFGDELQGLSSVKISAWLEKSGNLASYVEWCHEINSSTIKEKLSQDEKPKNTPSFWLEIEVNRNELKKEALGKIKLNEIEKLTTNHVEPPGYLDSILQLSKDYRSWMKSIASDQKIPADNPFSTIDSKAKVLLSKDPELIPLAIPTKCIEYCYSLLKDEACAVNASKAGVLIPYYDFKENPKTGARELKLVFDFVERKNPNERLSFAEFTLAEIDRETVKTFTQPTFDSEQNDNAPNLNELLLQALYTNLYPTLGMPGDKTASLGQGRWLAPSERSFPGFFAIWEKDPTKSIHFKLSEYNESVEKQFDRIVNETSGQNSISGFLGEITPPHFTENYLTVSAKVRLENKDLQNKIEKLEEDYQLLVAYCRFVSSIDVDTLYLSIKQRLGIMNPDSIYDYIRSESLPSKLSDKDKKGFKGVLESTPRPSLSQLKSFSCQLNCKQGR